MKSKKEEIAIDTFKSGLNCAQSVLTAYSDNLNFDNHLALRMACGFGAGMGRLQETCGAVTGSFMVFGIFNCNKFSDNKDRKEKTYEMIQSFTDKFIAIHDTTNCKSLINCDLKTERGRQYAHDKRLFEIVCEKCILDSIKIIEELIAE
ncbi:MAG: hypothetical protein AMS27_03020 [Bacteroides sp. SM23_62_1]|nr:MAG: hypothetical protein AMS27_03020 [Bacteroides sp. SM23_62_1]